MAPSIVRPRIPKLADIDDPEFHEAVRRLDMIVTYCNADQMIGDVEQFRADIVYMASRGAWSPPV